MTATLDEYNYSTFTTSEARGKTKVFASAVHAGDEAPDFELPTLDGETVRLSRSARRGPHTERC